MGRTHDRIDDALAAWLARQAVFFVATAPADGGHVNVSPKGLDTFRVLDDHTVAYLDLTGSGAETIAHLRDDGRITMMFCAFSGPPRIVRLHGRGEALGVGTDGYAALVDRFPDLPGARAVVCMSVERVADSCGYAVPLMDLVGPRDRLERWAEAKGPDGLVRYREQHNAVSIDGLPALDPT